MDSGWFGNRMDAKMVTLVIGWIGLALSTVGMTLLWYCYGDNIVFVVVYVYGQKYAKIWLTHIIIACGKLIIVKRIKILKPCDSSCAL